MEAENAVLFQFPNQLLLLLFTTRQFPQEANPVPVQTETSFD